MEQKEADYVGAQTERAHNHDQLRIRYLCVSTCVRGHTHVEHAGGHAPGVLKKRSMASIKMEKQSASRKTPLTRAARISARCHPYEYFVSVSSIFCAVSLKRVRKRWTSNIQQNTHLDCIQGNNQAHDIA